MKKRLIISLASVFFLAGLGGCTSSDTKSEGETDIVSESSVEQLEGQSAENHDVVVIEDSEKKSGESPTPEVATTDSPGVEALSDSSTPLNLDSPAPVVENAAPVTTDTGITETPIATTDSIPSSTENVTESAPIVEKPKATISPLQKVASAPYMVGKTWVNAVYLARPGDTLKSISKMIYGDDSRVAELKKINTRYKSRSVKPGDKIYYNSPVRPEDSTKIANFYEDSGVPSESYVAQKGDNIRKVSKKLLGYNNAWMEIWSTNPVDSKGKLAEGEVLRYWKGSAPAEAHTTSTLAQNNPPTHSDAAANLPPPPPMPDHSVPPPVADLPPPPPMPDHAAAGVAGGPGANGLPPPSPPPPMPDMNSAGAPPPPPPVELPPPPPQDMAANGNAMEQLPPPPADHPAPPAPKIAKESNAEETEVQGQLSTTELGILAAAAALAGALAFIIIRRKRSQKAAASMMSDSHVGT